MWQFFFFFYTFEFVSLIIKNLPVVSIFSVLGLRTLKVHSGVSVIIVTGGK